MAAKGASVALVGRNEKRLNEVGDRIKKCAGAPTPLLIVADVSSEAERIMSETIKHFGKLNVLINNAGILSRDTIETVDLDEYERIMKTNVRSVIELTKLAVPYLEKTKGNILNVSSSAGLRVKPNLFSYCISKAACNHLTKSCALDLAAKGIRVNAINPVVIKTGILTTGFRMSADEIDEFVDNLKNVYPVGRVGEVTDTSTAIEYLISDSASFITGQLIPIDGGALTAGK